MYSFKRILILFLSLFRALRSGAPADANPWGGVTLEWNVASPPPVQNFASIPTISGPTWTFGPAAGGHR